jgi:hypothetical protein
MPYKGAGTTAAVRASLQVALDNYTTGRVTLPPVVPGLDRSDTRSFGESHARELSKITSIHHSESSIPITPPITASSLPEESHRPPTGGPAKSQTAPIDPQMLNQAPAALPNPFVASQSAVVTDEDAPKPIIPTVAETGVPLSGGAGPASGSLRDIRAGSGPAGAVKASGTKYETAEEEKKRLQREERERVLAQPPPAPAKETAEEEKRRLEREERERLLRSQSIHDAQNKSGGEDLPPYPDF